MKRIALILPLALGGCAFTQAQLTEKASADLSCPAPELRVTRVDADQREVQGCGHFARYAPGAEQWTALAVDGRPRADARPVLGLLPEEPPPPNGVYPRTPFITLPR